MSTRTGSTYGRFDAGFLNRWNTIHSAFNVEAEHFPVQIEQRKRELIVHLRGKQHNNNNNNNNKL